MKNYLNTMTMSVTIAKAMRNTMSFIKMVTGIMVMSVVSVVNYCKQDRRYYE